MAAGGDVTSLSMTVAIAAGGALGALGRHFVSGAALRAFGPAFPYGTLIANTAGALAMGFLIEWLARRGGVTAEWRAFLTVGLLGAFTTFSTYALEFAVLIERKAYLPAAGYLIGSVLLAIAALFGGLALGRALL